MATKPCPEERCRQLRFFGSSVDYKKGHPRCTRCRGVGTITEEPVRVSHVSFEKYLEPFPFLRQLPDGSFVRTHDYEGDPLPQPIRLIFPPLKP